MPAGLKLNPKVYDVIVCLKKNLKTFLCSVSNPAFSMDVNIKNQKGVWNELSVPFQEDKDFSLFSDPSPGKF